MQPLIKMIPADYALKHRILPIKGKTGNITIATANPGNSELAQELRFIFNQKIIFEQWPEDRLLTAIHKAYQFNGHQPENAASADDQPFEHVEKHLSQTTDAHVPKVEDRSVIQLVNRFISEAIRQKASDIHVESYENTFRIRFRIDGKLMEFEKPPGSKRQAIVSRLKIVADMDIAEKRRPQDGRIRMKSGQRTVDIRVSTLPTDFGEKVVLRILDKSALQLSLENLGMSPEVLSRFQKVLKMPYGMVLVTGPTGSGKTTTLYAALNYLNRPDVNIITIEDPIEYNLQGINQTMVRADIGLTFANILRTVLRQDPNIIMLGEIRDGETAEIAVRSALTGHLVLSTLHTNDAVSTIVRLIDMGVEPFLVANSLKMVVAQRLIRKICPHCKTADKDAWQRFQHYHFPKKMETYPLYKGAGCQHCHQTGFSGREALIEHIIIDEEFAQHIQRDANIGELRALARSKGFTTLKQAGLKKAIEGKTTLAEVIGETFAV